MRSKFRAYYLIIQTVVAVLSVFFIALPFYVYLSVEPGQDNALPTIVVAVICAPLTWFLLKDYRFITIKLEDSQMRIKSVIKNAERIYNYSEIAKVEVKVYKTEMVTGSYRNTNKGIPFNSYEPEATVYFKDGYNLVLYDDVYANAREMVKLIDSRIPAKPSYI